MTARHISSPSIIRLASLIAVPLLAGCATAGVTYRSGVGDTFLEHPPYYAGAVVRADSGVAIHLPIAYQRGGSNAAMFDPAGGGNTPIAALLAEMNSFLDSLAVSVRLQPPVPPGTPPDVRFGCEVDEASGDCPERGDSALGRKGQRMKLAVGRPSAEWTSALRESMEGTGATRALVLTLEVGQYLIRQTGFRGEKSVELGTAHTVELPWVTSLETPVSVVQLTGAIVDTSGRAIRIGAEGLLAHRTPLLASALGAQALISDEDIQRLRSARREDLPGRPLTWRVAMLNLVSQLTGRGRLTSQ